MRTCLLVASVLVLAGCDSGVDKGPLFSALEGAWTSDAEPPTVRFLPNARYEFIAEGDLIEAGQVALTSDGSAPDPDALAALRQIQFYADDAEFLDPTAFTVVSADASTLTVQRCFRDCEGVTVDVYRRR